MRYSGKKYKIHLVEVNKVLKICSIASSSSGNCIYIGTDKTHLLLDAGISGKKVEQGLKKLGIGLSQINGMLITHEHSDHIKGLGVLERKYPLPMYMTGGTMEAIKSMSQIGFIPWEQRHTVRGGAAFEIGDIRIVPIVVSHDAAEPVAYRFEADGRRLAVITDLGHYNEEIVRSLDGLHAILLEANYDYGMLQTGSYPYPLKQRIHGLKGHLSNEDAGRLVYEIWNSELHHVLLGHLSKENNMPLLAYETVRSELLLSDAPQALASMKIEVLKREEISPLIQV